MTDARTLLARIRELPLRRKIRVMNVCGGHERSITMAGLRSACESTVQMSSVRKLVPPMPGNSKPPAWTPARSAMP